MRKSALNFIDFSHKRSIVDAMFNQVLNKPLNNFTLLIDVPAGNYMFKVNNRNTRKRCEICLELTITTPERCHKVGNKNTRTTSIEHRLY